MRLLAATNNANNGVFKTTNEGTVWAETGLMSSTPIVYCLMKTSSDIIFAGCDSGSSNLFKSTDDGDTWVFSQNIGSTQVQSLLEDSDGNLYAGTATDGRIYKSTDDGDTWVNTGNLSGADYVYSIIETSNGDLYAGTYPDGNVFKSTDGGDNWVNTGNLSGADYVNVLLEGSDGVLYAGASGGKIFKTENAGVSWIEIVSFASATYVYSLLETSSGNLYAGTFPYSEIFFSSDFGDNWVSKGDITGIYLRAVYSIIEVDDILYAATDNSGNIYKSIDDGDNWVNTGDLSGATVVYDIINTELNISILLNYSQVLIKPYNQVQLIATTIPEGETVTWTSSNIRAADVDSNGLVQVYSRGTTTITASITGASATCEITIEGVKMQSAGLYSLKITDLDTGVVKDIGSTPQDGAFVFTLGETTQKFYQKAAGQYATEARTIVGPATLTVDFQYSESLAQFLKTGLYANSTTKTTLGLGASCLKKTFEVIAHPKCLPSGDKARDIKLLQATVDVNDEITATAEGEEYLRCVFDAQNKEITLPTPDAITLTAGSGDAKVLYWILYATNGTGLSVGTAELASAKDDDAINFTLPIGATGGTFYAGTATGPATALKYYEVTSDDITAGKIEDVGDIYDAATSATALPTTTTGYYHAAVEKGA